MVYHIQSLTGVEEAVIASLAGAALSSTGSMTTAAVQAGNYAVTVQIKVKNYYNKALNQGLAYREAGYIGNPPSTIGAGYEEAVGGHNTQGTATGTYGTVGWTISETNYKVIIMWMVPYDHNLYSNTLAIGIKNTHTSSDYSTMYDSSDYWFVKEKYYSTIREIRFEKYGFYVTATMGSDSTPMVEVKFYPTDCTQVSKTFQPLIYCPAFKSAKRVSGEEIGESEIDATATFSLAESGVEGTVVIDENGNIFTELDISELNLSECDFGNNAVSFEYYIYDSWNYVQGDLQSKHGSEACGSAMTGVYYDPLNVGMCTDIKDVNYINCAIGDLSGRFGVVEPTDDNKLSHIGNISDMKGKTGFCGKRLTPAQLYRKSVVFACNDGKAPPLFCAPFVINIDAL